MTQNSSRTAKKVSTARQKQRRSASGTEQSLWLSLTAVRLRCRSHSLPRIKRGTGAVCFRAVTTRDSRAPFLLPAASWQPCTNLERVPQRPGAWPRGSRPGGSGIPRAAGTALLLPAGQGRAWRREPAHGGTPRTPLSDLPSPLRAFSLKEHLLRELIARPRQVMQL